MGLRIRTNVASINAQNRLAKTTNAITENTSKLASGFRINKSADDAAGLAISEGMRARIRSLNQASRNANDGVSMIQTAEGSMNEISNILIRLRELATQASSDTIGNLERSFTNREYTELVGEIDRIANTTEFNGLPMLKGAGALNDEGMFSLHIGAGDGTVENTDTIRLNVDNIVTSSEILGLSQEDGIGPAEEGDDFARATAAEKLTILDNALKTVASNRAYLGAQQSRLNSAISNLGIQVENLQSANSRIRDVDFASETASFTQNKILQQSGAAVLSQANSQPEIALALLR
jgi:flagellin